MESVQNKPSRHNARNLNDDYSSADRNHQRTEKEVGNLSPAKDELEKRKARTKRANATPDRKKIN